MSKLNRPHGLSPTKGSARVVLAHRGVESQASHVGLGITCLSNMRSLRADGYWAEVWPCADAGDLDRMLVRSQDRAVRQGDAPVTHAVIAALWMGTAELAGMAMRHPEVHFSVVSHSNIGFLQADPGAVKLLRDALDLSIGQHNVSVGGNCQRFVRAFSSMYGRDMLWLPNLYDVSTIRRVGLRQPWVHGSTLRLGVFGATRILKNMVTAVAACVELGAELRCDVEVHMNVGRSEGAGTTRVAIDQLVARLPHTRLIEVGWQSWPEFRSHAARMNLLVAPSYTESFCMCVADGIAEGVASVVSDAIDWAPADWMAPSDDVAQIAKTARRLLSDHHAVNDGQGALREYVGGGLRAWRTYLSGEA
jgi:hypothetical protein